MLINQSIRNNFKLAQKIYTPTVCSPLIVGLALRSISHSSEIERKVKTLNLLQERLKFPPKNQCGACEYENVKSLYEKTLKELKQLDWKPEKEYVKSKDKTYSSSYDSQDSENIESSFYHYMNTDNLRLAYILNEIPDGAKKQELLAKLASAYIKRGLALFVFYDIIMKMTPGPLKDQACLEAIDALIKQGSIASIIDIIDVMSEGPKKQESLGKLASLYIKQGFPRHACDNVIVKMTSGPVKDQACVEAIHAFIAKGRPDRASKVMESMSEGPKKQELVAKLAFAHIKEGWPLWLIGLPYLAMCITILTDLKK